MSYERPVGLQESTIAQFRKEAYHANDEGGFDRYVSISSIARFIYKLMQAKMDAHVIISGQNGIGKSYAMLAIMKEMLKVMGMPDSFTNAETQEKIKFFYAYHKREELTSAIQTHQKCVFGIDELKVFFDYKRSQTRKQNDLYNMVEVARSNLNAYIGCTRELDKLDNNYRNAKAQVLIRLWDRAVNPNDVAKTEYVYGAVFVGNPSIELSDKFMQDSLMWANSIPMAMKLSETLPTFVGVIVFKDVSAYGITPDDIAVYEREKALGIQNYGNKWGTSDGPKRPRGRPRTKVRSNAPKRPVGRPRKLGVVSVGN